MRKVITSGIIANSLEWYDYALYGLLTPVISKLFFPSEDPFTSLIATFCVFAAGFLMRPIGALLFGYIGDEFGRRVALVSSILLMAIPTACIGLLPTYQHIGIAAPILLTLLRLLQGLSLGGAFSGSMTFIIEHAPDNKRGIAGSTTMFSMVLGVLMGSLVSGLISYLCTPSQFDSWGWRIAFLLGTSAGLAGLYIQHELQESPKYLQAKKNGSLSSHPLKELISDHLSSLVLVIGLTLLLTVPFYTVTVFMITAMDMLGYSRSDALFTNTLSMLALLVTIPISAWISDKVGRKPVLIVIASLFLMLSIPLFWVICLPNISQALWGHLTFAALLGLYIGPLPAALVEAVPTKIRYTSMSLGYNSCITLFGGTVPLVATSITRFTDNNAAVGEIINKLLGNSIAAIAIYISFAAIFTLITLYFYKERYKEEL